MDKTFLAAQGDYVLTTTLYQDNKAQEWQAVKYQVHLTLKCLVLLFDRKDHKSRGQGRILPDAQHLSRFFY